MDKIEQIHFCNINCVLQLNAFHMEEIYTYKWPDQKLCLKSCTMSILPTQQKYKKHYNMAV